MLGNFPCFFFGHLLTFFNILKLSKNSFRNAIRVQNGLDQDQDRQKLPLAGKELYSSIISKSIQIMLVPVKHFLLNIHSRPDIQKMPFIYIFKFILTQSSCFYLKCTG